MFLERLLIRNVQGIIRDIRFHSGMNLIVDETLPGSGELTGNNVGKTTVLMLIGFCLGADAKNIYTDHENRKNEYALVKNFLIDTEVVVSLTLTSDLSCSASKKITLERNFLPRNKMIRLVNGEHMTDSEFEEFLTNDLFSGHYGKKPTFPQIISHNMRYKEPGISNTLKTLNQYTSDDEYETLYLFLLGCEFGEGDEKQRLLTQLRLEQNFKNRLEAGQTKSAYESLLALLLNEIVDLDKKKASFNINPELELELRKLDDVKYKINKLTVEKSRARLRYNLIVEAVDGIKADKAEIDIDQLKVLYNDVAGRLSGVQKSFEQLVDFHNKMVEEKIRYISKDLPDLENAMSVMDFDLSQLLEEERTLAENIVRSGSLEELECIGISLNDKHRLKGEYETHIQQISEVDENIRVISQRLIEINEELFSDGFGGVIKNQLNKFNVHFSAVSQELYGEVYALKVDRARIRSGEPVYKFSAFSKNLSSGKKQGEITCFDIAYTLFADEEHIPCYHFLLNDKKELMHDNQLSKIARVVERRKNNVQFVASILKDKLPVELDDEKFFVLKLSQKNKLLRIE